MEWELMINVGVPLKKKFPSIGGNNKWGGS